MANPKKKTPAAPSDTADVDVAEPQKRQRRNENAQAEATAQGQRGLLALAHRRAAEATGASAARRKAAKARMEE